MAFRMHHSVVLPCPLDAAWPVFSDPKYLPHLQHALPNCKGCTVLSAQSEPFVGTQEEAGVVHLNATSRPSDLPWPDLDSTIATSFEFKLGLSKVNGVQIAYLPLVLFHSQVKLAGIEEFKLRVLERLSETETKVTETVWGTAPALIAAGLRISGIAARTHRKHMESYAALLAEIIG